MGGRGNKSKNFNLMAIVVILILASPCIAYAWLTDSAVKEAQDLIEYTGQEGNCPDPERLSFLIAFSGLSYLDEEYLDLIGENYQNFSTIFANSQRPPRVPNCWIQAFCRQYSNSSQREEMLVSLRAWLTEEISQAQSGNMVMISPTAITQGVLEATEALVEWGDPKATYLINDYLLRNNVDEKFRVQFAELKLCLKEPCSRALFRKPPNGQPLVCYNAEDLPEIELQSSDFRNSGRSVYSLSNQEKKEFITLINSSQLGLNIPKGNVCKSSYLVLRFANGYQACVQIPSCGSDAIFYDNGPSEFCPKILLMSKDLYRWGEGLINHRTSKSNK